MSTFAPSKLRLVPVRRTWPTRLRRALSRLLRPRREVTP
jgi:hypothetical protein